MGVPAHYCNIMVSLCKYTPLKSKKWFHPMVPFGHRLLGMCNPRNRHAYRHVIYRVVHGDGGAVMDLGGKSRIATMDPIIYGTMGFTHKMESFYGSTKWIYCIGERSEVVNCELCSQEGEGIWSPSHGFTKWIYCIGEWKRGSEL